MEKNLLEFYRSNVLIDPEITDEDISGVINLVNKFNKVDGLYYLYRVYSEPSIDLQTYKYRREDGFSDYFTSVSGNKVVRVKEGDYLGIIDLWYPNEIPMFNLVRNPIMAGWVISDLLTHGISGEDIIKFSKPMTPISESMERLKKEIMDTVFYGFWMWDTRNSERIKPIKIRKLEVLKIEIPPLDEFRDLFPSLTMRDMDSKEVLTFDINNLGGWNFYLSKEYLSERLKDLESFWMRGYDRKVKVLDHEIQTKKIDLKNLIKRRKNLGNGITEYRSKLHEILWKNF